MKVSKTMLADKQTILGIIYTCLEEINAGRAAEARLKLAPETRLLGSGGELDSLEVVNLIVGLEALLAERLHCAVVLVDESTFGGSNHPFRDVESLATYIATKVGVAG
jgi:acyl carrier protein